MRAEVDAESTPGAALTQPHVGLFSPIPGWLAKKLIGMSPGARRAAPDAARRWPLKALRRAAIRCMRGA
jgi:hypothetical protein